MEEEQKNPVGRPLKYKTVEELELAIEKYFGEDLPYRKVVVGPPNNKHVVDLPMPTVTGLCLYLGFVNRASFLDYEERGEFSSTIKSARSAIEQHYEELLQGGLGSGAIFALKNFGWKDQTDITSGGLPFKPVEIYDLRKPEDKNEDRDETAGSP